MKTRLVTTLREFDALAPVWHELQRESGQTSPFLSHDWLACCWRTAGPHRKRQVLIFEDAAGPLAVFPLVHFRARKRGLPVRVISFLEAPESPFNDFLVARDLDKIVERFLADLYDRHDWDEFAMHKVPGHSVVLKGLSSALAGNPLHRMPWRDVTPTVTASGTWEEFLRARPEALRESLSAAEKHFRSIGAAVEHYDGLDLDAPVFRELLDLIIRNWRSPRGGILTMGHGALRFLRELTPRLTARAWLRLWVLRTPERMLAAEYQLVGGDGIRTLRIDADPGPGAAVAATCLTGAIVRDMFEVRRPDDYHMGASLVKQRIAWATGGDEVFYLKLYAPTPYGNLLHQLETKVLPLAERYGSQAKRGEKRA